jgi:hypothetical protein
MSESISSELNYSPVVNNHSTVIYRNIAPQGSSSITLGSSLSSPVEFVISPSCWNPSKSKLNFQINLTTSGTKFNFFNGNTACAIGRITVYDSATNSLLMDCSNFEKYAQLIIPTATDVEDFLTKAMNLAIPAATSAASTPFPVEDLGRVNSATNLNSAGTSMAAYNPYTGKREWYLAAAGAAVLDVSIPFSAFKFSFLSTNSVLYSPSNLIVQCYFNAVDQFLVVSNSATDPSAATQTSAAGTIANLSISLANEGNLAVVSQVIDKVMKQGVTLPLAYPTCIRQSISKSTSHSYQIQLSKAYGNRILFIATSPFTPSRGGTYTDDLFISRNNYHPRGALTLYNSFLNGIAISYPPGYDCTKGQDYSLANKEFLRKSVIQTSGEYINGNWVHVDSFIGCVALCDVDQSKIDGLDVGSQNSVFQLQATLYGAADGYDGGVAATWVNVIAGQKTMTFSSNGVMVQ